MTTEDKSGTSQPADISLANRYGRPKRGLSRRAKRWAVIVALAIGMGFLAWVSTSNATASVTFKDIGYRTTDATQSVVDFQVTREPGTAVKCAVKALDSKFAVVGWKVVDIPPVEQDAQGQSADGGRTLAQRVVLRTESQAVSGVVDSCWIPKPAA
ncbi:MULTISPECIES: DUF4307 domain-containing protein [unclassified Arthrobacter]|uniref:DUF4307 domain-containing protein n=1 Tax=unclassified Arthrobacter TaxID=235627 RepID=UPI001F1E996B|nr:DUF4307 domain-containing protein [Arthrobacter sp. FW305-BF8]UKA55661.1 DUF4307 domain-containing protein [Arthrobacter sp. FW305-BF8]